MLSSFATLSAVIIPLAVVVASPVSSTCTTKQFVTNKVVVDEGEGVGTGLVAVVVERLSPTKFDGTAEMSSFQCGMISALMSDTLLCRTHTQHRVIAARFTIVVNDR